MDENRDCANVTKCKNESSDNAPRCQVKMKMKWWCTCTTCHSFNIRLLLFWLDNAMQELSQYSSTKDKSVKIKQIYSNYCIIHCRENGTLNCAILVLFYSRFCGLSDSITLLVGRCCSGNLPPCFALYCLNWTNRLAHFSSSVPLSLHSPKA